MRVVDLEADLVDADDVAVGQPRLVVEDAAPDAARHVRRGRLGQLEPNPVSSEALLPQLVGALEHVGHPADLALAVGDPQLREAVEDAARRCSRRSEPMAFWKVSVELMMNGASGAVAGIFDDEPMCMLRTVSVSSQAAKNGSQ